MCLPAVRHVLPFSQGRFLRVLIAIFLRLFRIRLARLPLQIDQTLTLTESPIVHFSLV